MKDTELAFRTGALFNKHITDAFWSSFKGEYGRVQVEVLVYLFDNGQVQASEIAEGLNISKQHVSKIVALFIRTGYVCDSPNETDKRANVLTLTEQGRRYLAAHFAASDHSFEALVGAFSETEKARFIQAMKDISDLISQYTEADRTDVTTV